MLDGSGTGARRNSASTYTAGTMCLPWSWPPHGCHGHTFLVALCTIPLLGKLSQLFGCLGPPLSSSHSPQCLVVMMIVRFSVGLLARSRGGCRSVPSARERASMLARGSLRRPLLHAWFGARPKVVQTRKMGVLPAQKCSGGALRAYLSGRDVGWYVCSIRHTSAAMVPPCGSARRP